MIDFTIHGIIRGGKNNINITRTGRRYPNKSWAIFRDRVVNEIRDMMRKEGLKTFENRLKIEIGYYNGDLRRRDVPAMLDSLWSCMEKAELVKDDCLFTDVNWFSMGMDKTNPRVEIRIEEI